MINPFLFKDNLLLHLKNASMKMDTKVWATGEENKFKVCSGMDAVNRHYDTKFLTMYEVESMAIDHIVMGYEVLTNFIFMDGVDGVVKRRVHSLSLLQGAQVCSSSEAICDRGNSEDTEIKVIYEGLTKSGILPSDN